MSRMNLWNYTEESWQGTKSRPAARWRRCSKSNDIVARRKAYEVSETLGILKDMYPDTPVQVLTTTLPGSWHPVRNSTLVDQYDYMTKRVTLPGMPGSWSMRGLNKKLTDESLVLGGWHFFESKHTNKWWHLHCHSILFGDASDAIPVSDYEVPAFWNESGGIQSKKLISSTSGFLHNLGFGERYTLDEATSIDEQVSYCTKLAYCTKGTVDGPEKELVAFLRQRKPRLTEAFGAARLSTDDRVAYYIENDDFEKADYLMSTRYNY